MDEERSKIILNDSLKKLAKSSLVVFIGIFISKIFGYVYRIVIARTFDPRQYGLYSLAVFFASLFSLIAALGIDSGSLRFLSFYHGKKNIKKRRYIFKFSFVIMFIASLTAGLVLFLFSDLIAIQIFKDSALSTLLKYVGVFLPALTLTGIPWNTLKSYEKIGWFSFLSNIFYTFLQLLLLITLIFLKVGDKAIILSYVLGYFGVFLASLIVCRYKTPEVFGKSNLNRKQKQKIRKELLSYSWPMMFLSIAFILFYDVGSFFIGYFWNTEKVGIYNAAVPIASLLGFVPMLFISLFFPLITKEFSAGNKKVIEELSKQVSKWIFILNLPLLIIILLFPGALVNLFFGSQYLSAATALQFLSIGIFFYSIFTISENLLSMAGKSKIILSNMLVATLTSIIFNIILTPKYGIEGTSFAIMLAYIFWGAFSFFQSKRYLSIIPIRKKMIRIFLISLIPTTILFFLRFLVDINSLLIIPLGILFILIYLILIWITKGFDDNDLMILKKVKEKFLK